ncbi:MAG: lamin tail domain-containing protein [Bacteroidales bacterium]|nr:lamin tail domain-containing protein [Bacteroidales bacterium]
MRRILLLFVALTTFAFVQAQCNDLFISEYVEGSGNNKAIEIYNPTDQAIDLSAYRLVRYSNGGTTPNAVNLAGTINAYDVYVVVLDKRNPNGTGLEQPVDSALQLKADTFLCPVYDVNKMMYFNGNDAVTLEKDGGSVIVDIFARVGSPDPINGWTNITDTTITWNNGGTPEDYTIVNYIVGPLFWLSWTRNHTLIRKATVEMGIVANPAVFNVAVEWDTLAINTFGNLGAHQCDCESSSVSELHDDVNISFFPNPVTDGKLNIESAEKIHHILVYNVFGQSIIEHEYNGVFSLSIETSELTSGIYFIKVGFDDQSFLIKKIINQ